MKKNQKTTEKEESKDEITLDTFVDIANKSKDVKDFMRKVVAIKGVPSSVANEFQNKYGNGGELTMEQASQNFMDAAKGKEKEVTREIEKPEEKKESPESKKETSKPQLSPDQKKGLGSISKLTTQAKELNKKQIYDTKSFKINKDTLKDMVDVSSQIEEKFLSKETRDKIDEIKEELDNFVNKDVYVQKPNGKRGKFLNRDKEFESDLEDKETLSDKIKFIVDEYNKENEDGESEIVGIDEYFPKIKDLLVDMAKEHSSKKATEILNYKLF